jgi:DUF4097 and DUF4098 domain-containing protein YvlB
MPALLLLTGCEFEDFAAARYNQDFHYSYPLNPGGRFTLETFNGSVEISSWDQPNVDISGTKYGPSQEAADQLHVDISHSPGAVEVRVQRPGDFRGNRGAKFSVKLPRGAVVERITSSNGGIQLADATGPSRLRTSNGSIRIRGLRGGVEARTSNGPIELTDVSGGDVVARTSNGHIHGENIDGPLDATTSNGAINLAVAGMQPVRVETSNGSVDLRLPANFSNSVRASSSNAQITLRAPGSVNARLTAHTSNSSIHSDFDVSVQGEINKNALDGVIGNGGPMFDLTTSNGAIRLVKM